MAYLGRQPIVGNYQVLDALTATTTDTYALTKNSVAVFPQTPANCIVSLNGVIQAPFDSYTISGSNIVFASALTGSDSIDFITVLGDVLNVGTVSDGTIGLAKLSATGTKDATTFLRGDNTFASAGGTNTPAFLARNSVLQSLSDDTMTKVQFNSVVYDTEGGAYDNVTNYRFTVPSGQGGKYAVYSKIIIDSEVASNLDGALIEMRKNNSSLVGSGNNEFNFLNSPIRLAPVSVFAAVQLNAGDYLEVYCRIEATDATGGRVITNGNFGAYKLIG